MINWNFEKNKKVYIGIGALALLIFYCSTRKPVLKEVIDPTLVAKEFDNSSLPSNLQPPYKLAEGETTNTAKRKSMTGLSFMPRFDRY